MTRNDTLLALMRAGFYCGKWTDLDDERYDAISPEFVTLAWDEWVKSLPDELKERRDVGNGVSRVFPKWIPEVFDCDDHTDDFGGFLERCMAVDAVRTGKPRGSAARGLLKFIREAANGHAVTWFVDYDGTARVFDAGIGKHLTFTVPQLQSIFGGE